MHVETAMSYWGTVILLDRHETRQQLSHADRQLRTAVEQNTPPDPNLKAIDLIAEAERQLWANVNLKQVLENLAVQWTQAGEAVGTGSWQ